VLAEAGGRPVPTATALPAESFAVIDLSHLAAPARASHADRLCAGLAADLVELAAGPLARLTVLRLAPQVHRAVLVLHRVVADDASVPLLVGELSAYYAAAVRGAHPVPGPVAQYPDYARWQREQETTPAYRRLLDWWTATLTPLPPPPALPTDRDRSAVPATHGGVLRFDWGETTAARLAALCASEGAAPLAVVLAAFQALLCRYGDQDRVAVAVPVAVRPPAYASTIGPFENLLVLCGDLTGSPTFRELVGRVTRVVRAALDHRTLPFDRVVRALNPDRDPGRVPLCDIMLAVREEPEAAPRLAGAEVSRHDLDTGAVADLALTVDRVWPSVAGNLAYRFDLLERASAEVVLDQLRTLLTAALATPDAVVADLPLDSAERARAIAEAGDRLAAGAVVTEPVHELVRRHAVPAPAGVPAVAGAGGTVSYGELERAAAQVAGRLCTLGVGGSAVAVRMSPGPRQLAASLGALRAGAHLVWFGTGDAGERGRAVLGELRPACLLREGDPDAGGDELARWYRDELGGTVLDIGAIGDTSDTSAIGAISAISARGEAALDRVAYVAYTSGSTGKPKGIAQTHGAFAQFVTWMAAALGIGPGSRVAQWVAPEHDPSLCEVFATLVAGGTLCPVPDRIRVHPDKLAAWLAEQRITFLQTVPSFARELLKAITSRGLAGSLGCLERLVLMGEALPAELVNGLRAALPGVALTNMYGPTETIAATWCDITAAVHATVPIGRAIPGRQVLVLDGADRPCPVGVTGEIVIRSPYVARGYLGDENGGEAFRPVRGLGQAVRTYRTGDLARWRGDGQLECHGRRDLQVKLLGNRVELAEVEAALAEHESVAECAVVPLRDRDGLVVQLVAYIVPRRTPSAPQAAPPAAAWRAHLRRRFGASMVLVSFQTLDGNLPRNVAGKVDRRRLPVPRAAGTGTGTGTTRMPQVPGTWVERGVAEIWSQLLGGPTGDGGLGADESFFAVGGHSLLVPQLVDRIRQRFGVEIPVRECFVHSTVAGMSALIASAGVREDPAA
jgi:amino acid adenylation domain-containing protein